MITPDGLDLTNSQQRIRVIQGDITRQMARC